MNSPELSRVESRLMLRPTVSRPVRFGTKHPPGTYEQIFITVRQLRALPLKKRRVCHLQQMLALSRAVIFGS
jgi:hypothetical protein